MSIKRVSDLPSIEGLSTPDSLEKFKRSFMEVSYLSSDAGGSQTYASRKVKVQELLDGFRDLYYSRTPISGNISVNCDTNSDPNGTVPLNGYGNYKVAVHVGDMLLHSDKGVLVESLDDSGVSAGSFTVTTYKDWAEYGPNQLVRKKALEDKLAQISSEIYDKLMAQIGQIGAGTFKLLMFVHSDHAIDDECWAQAGEKVDLDQHLALRAALGYGDGYVTLYGKKLASCPGDEIFNGFQLLKDDENNATGMDDARYLQLPTFTSCFIESVTAQPEDSYTAQTVQAGIPNLSGWFGQLPSDKTTRADGKLFRRTDPNYKTGPNDGTKGNKDRRIIFNASGCSKIYKNDCKTVQPQSVKMLVYYYVGPKTAQQGNG